MSAILLRLPRRLSIRLSSYNYNMKQIQCCIPPTLSTVVVRHHTTSTIETDIDIINTETKHSIDTLQSTNELEGFSEEIKKQIYIQLLQSQLNSKQEEKLKNMENEIERLKETIKNKNISTKHPVISFEDRILSIFEQPPPKLTPLLFGEQHFTTSKQFFQQFLPYIITDIYKSIQSSLDKIEYKQYKPIKSRFLASTQADGAAYATTYIACKLKNLPKLDHSFNSEVICLRLPEQTSLFNKTSTTSTTATTINSNNQHNFILGIAKKVDNLEKERNLPSKLQNTMIYESETCIKIQLRKCDYEQYYQSMKTLSSHKHNNDDLENINFNNKSLYWHHLCGITPSLRQYNACVHAYKPNFYTQIQNLQAIQWPAVVAAVPAVVADASIEQSSTGGNTDIDRAVVGKITEYEEERLLNMITSTPVLEAPAPVLEAPVVSAPVLEAPVVSAPVLEVPVVSAPVLEAPVLEAPAPVLEAPVVPAPVLEAPVLEAPVLEVPVLEAPVLEAPVLEVPVLEAPVLEAPAAYALALNTQQQNVVERLLSPEAQGIHCLVGPPGTGKTTTMVHLLAERSSRYPKEKILLTGPSNKSVKVVLQQLLEKIKNPPLVVLVGVMRSDVPKDLEEIYAAKYAECLNKQLINALNSDTILLNKINNIKYALNEIHKRLKKIISSQGCNVQSIIIKHVLDLYKYIKNEEKEFIFAEIEISNESELEKRVSAIYSKIDNCAYYLESYLTQKAQIIFSTLVASGRAGLYKIIKKVDTVFVDEASQALLPETFIPLKYNPKLFVLIGDPQQLPGSVSCQSLVQLGYADSLMARLTEGVTSPYVQMLTTQYRMHPCIGKWSSDCFYDRQLSAATGLEDRLSPLHILPSSMLLRHHPSAFIDVASQEEKGLHGEITNTLEAEAVVNTAKYLLDKGIQPDQIGIITFYAAQARLIIEKLRLLKDHNSVIGALLSEVTVSSVDGFQGDERDITLISCVRSNVSAGFMNDHRRINVATSRAKHARWIFGNQEGLSRSNTAFRDFFHWTQNQKENNTLPRTQIFNLSELYRSLSIPPSHILQSKSDDNNIQQRQKKKEAAVIAAAAAGITPCFDAPSICSSSTTTTTTTTTTTNPVPTVFMNSDAMKVTEQWW